MPSIPIKLVGKSGSKFNGNVNYVEGGGSLGCHAIVLHNISVTVAPYIDFQAGDDIRANPEANWPVIYDALAKVTASKSHIVMSDNFATHGPRDRYLKYLVAQKLNKDSMASYASTIYRTSEIMQILASEAPKIGHSMTLSATSGNSLHLDHSGYSACVTGVWVKPNVVEVVVADKMDVFWDKVKEITTVGGKGKYVVRPIVDAKSLSGLDPEKQKQEEKAILEKVANIWGD